jgi:hypothetical protein
MTLPMMQTPTYELTIPSTKKKVKFRPFLVKEQKALMIAQHSEDPQTMIDTLKDIIKNCVQNTDVNKLAMFDLEYIFLQLRAKSIGEIADVVYSCLQCNDPKAKVTLNIDLSTINVEFNKDHKETIELFGDVGVKMRYPGLDLLSKVDEIDMNSPDDALKVISQCIEYIYDGDKIYDAKDQTAEELNEFLENLTDAQFKKIKLFFETMPKLKKNVQFDCPVCKFHHNYNIQGINNFF